MKQRTWLCILLSLCISPAFSSLAGLLNVGLSFPKISFNNVGSFALSYTPSNQLFSISATPSLVLFSSVEPPKVITGVRSLQIQFLIDNTGAVAGSSSGNDFVLTGTVTRGTNTYTGVLLTGKIAAFGSLESGVTDQYDFRFTPTGGALLGLFCGDISVQVTSEASTFSGDFTVPFNGRAKGTIGSEDIIPPTIMCPTNIVVESQSFSGGIPGAFVTYATPVVTDNCDQNPTVICTPPSGSFFALPATGSSTNYTVTCVAEDAAGNTNVCSFTITVEDTLPPEFADTNNPIIMCSLTEPMTLTNDAGMCFATYVFPAPFAIDNSSQTNLPAMVSAVDENGASLPVVDLGNGNLEIQFPVNVSGSNVVTITASDGRGNTSQHQCAIVVVDRDPPTIVCKDQTVTFRPILTNALSCIEADLDDVCITKSNYLWFSSVINNPACRNGNGNFTLHVFDQTITLVVDNTNVTLTVPDAYVIVSNGVATATTVFTNGVWITTTKPGLSGNTFVSGLNWQAPFSLNNRGGLCWGRDDDGCDDHFRRRVRSATWCGRFAVDKPGVVLQWQWGAVVSSKLSTNCNLLGVKPVDDDRNSCFRNNDCAGACENFKSFLCAGGRGHGCAHGRTSDDCTGVLSDKARVNLGKGMVCEGAVDFTEPMAMDVCGHPATVVCTPAPGSVLGPGVYPVTCVATDNEGNSNQCTFNLTVLSPLQVVFDTPGNDNLNDNTSQPDDGFNDMNCPDDPSTPQIVTQFCVGQKVPHRVRLLDCNGNDVTCSVGSSVTVHIDVTERQGTYANSVLVADEPDQYFCVGSPGGIMVLNCCEFEYDLNTTGFESGTANNNRFFRSCVWVDYNSSPGIPVGMEDVILENK